MTVWSTHLGWRPECTTNPPRLMLLGSSVRRAWGWRAAQPKSPLPARRRWGALSAHTRVTFMRKQSSCPPSTIFRAISWRANVYFWAFCHSDKKKDRKNWFGSSAEPKQQTLNVAFPIDAFWCQTSLLLQKQWARDVALKNAFFSSF